VGNLLATCLVGRWQWLGLLRGHVEGGHQHHPGYPADRGEQAEDERVTQIPERDHHQGQDDGGEDHLPIDDGNVALDLWQHGRTHHRTDADAAEQQPVAGCPKAQILADDHRPQRPQPTDEEDKEEGAYQDGVHLR